MFYVRVDHLTEEQLEFFGYHKTGENEEFLVLEHYTGEEHLLRRNGMRFLYVEDINDAVAMSAEDMIQLPAPR